MHLTNYGSKELFFELKQSKRKTLTIEVHPDSSIVVFAPDNISVNDIKKHVEKKGRWIVKQQAFFEQFLPRTPERKYVSGETHFYLGKGYLLKVIKGDKNDVKLKHGKLLVTIKKEGLDHVRKVLAYWYYLHADKKVKEIADDVYSQFKEYKFEKPKIELKRMPKRWGSCNTKDNIKINPEVIKAPTKCVEYVLIHEFCHMVIPNHKKEFYDLLSEKMPNWKKWKDRLEKSSS